MKTVDIHRKKKYLFLGWCRTCAVGEVFDPVFSWNGHGSRGDAILTFKALVSAVDCLDWRGREVGKDVFK